jgi:hypothetical protein
MATWPVLLVSACASGAGVTPDTPPVYCAGQPVDPLRKWSVHRSSATRFAEPSARVLLEPTRSMRPGVELCLMSTDGHVDVSRLLGACHRLYVRLADGRGRCPDGTRPEPASEAMATGTCTPRARAFCQTVSFRYSNFCHGPPPSRRQFPPREGQRLPLISALDCEQGGVRASIRPNFPLSKSIKPWT